MKITGYILVLLLVLFFNSPGIAGNIHHNLKVNLKPEQNFIEVIDEITIPVGSIPAEQLKQLKSQVHFLIHGDLSIRSNTSTVKLEKIQTKIEASQFGVSNTISLPEKLPIQHFQFKIPENQNADFKFVLQYQGKIYHPIKQKGEEYARSFSETPGIISEKGVLLAGSSYWIPWFNEKLVSFDLEVTLPENWDVASQGKRTIHEIRDGNRIVRWESPEIMDEIYLIAAPFHLFSLQVGKVTAMAYLRSPDEALANKYLETTAQYLEMFERLIGPYPYSKFALIENFWETGYGMPSFTLLGPKVIRFPFILHSSYPHELLHNWWGNSVFVDYEKGNWCEGLTVFYADHLIKEQRGQGDVYRRDALQAYTDYVKSSRDFPLTEFRARHDASSAAIGYNKSMMIFNMLRQRLGDDQFTQAIQLFYRDNKFKKATFQDVQQAFETISGEKLTWFFDQWVKQPGAPEIQITSAKSKKVSGRKFQLSFTLAQRKPLFQLQVPVAIILENQPKVRWEVVDLKQKSQTYSIDCDARPLKVDVDPQFDLFRRLDRNEIPPAFSQVFGSEKVTIILPDEADPAALKGYQQLAQIWGKSKQVSIIMENEVKNLPKDQAIWLFGLKNKWAKRLEKSMLDYGVHLGTPQKTDSIRIARTILPLADHCYVLALPNPENNEKTIAWLAVSNFEAISGLSRKLPHYGKYSYLGFQGAEPTNILKGQWPTIHSPLSLVVQQSDNYKVTVKSARLPIRKPLANLAPLFSQKSMLKHVEYLASDQLKGRGLGTPELEQAAKYIAQQFQQAGLRPGSDDDSYFQTWQDLAGEPEKTVALKNVIGYIPGSKADWKAESVVICAHYDHLGLGWPDVRGGNQGKIHNGADDNASGVSVLIELARHLQKSVKPSRNLVFVAFTGEEAGLRGSKQYVEQMKQFPVKKVMGALNLDTVGRLNDQKILILGGNSAREWVHIFMGCGYVTGVKNQLVQEELDASDQMSFIRQGVPAVQLFTGPHFDYHRPTDDIEKIDAAGMVKVATFVKEAILHLAERDQPLTVMGKPMGGTPTKPAHPGGRPRSGGARRVSLGTMPDFEYAGEGVRIGAVTPGSAAEKAGLKKGDVLKKVGDVLLKSLRDLAGALKKYQPGDKVTVVYERDGEKFKVDAVLTAR